MGVILEVDTTTSLFFLLHCIRGTQFQFAPFLMMLTLLFFLAAPRGMQDLSSPTRDQTRAPCSESVESQPLDCQGIPDVVHLDCLLKVISARLPHCEVTLFFFESLSILGDISPLFFEYFLVFWHKMF